MNKNKLKSYAPQARKDFIAAVTARANLLGLSSSNGHLEIMPATHQGDVTLIDGRSWPGKVFAQRESLIKRMKREGFEQTVEAVAYTWFNRFAALRFMELHDCLDHGYRVLSNVTGGEGGNTPAILLHAVDLAQGRSLPGLNAGEVTQLKLAGNQDGELYRRLLVAQCNVLSNAMPFLFERIDDETELLLPDNLLRTDSVIAKLVSEIPEEDWQEVEVIGWLYQFYISEKKDAVIGKVVKSEDIPAATQLFTPNWIVQYLVQNSVGRLWSMANPASTLKGEWDYYIEPAEQTPEVNAQLDALIQTRIAEDGGNLNPESITVLDPACGSGHILVVAYDVLKAIYLERGYQARAIPRLILEKNLYGLDIDDRAAQLAGFALLMKARADDRRLLDDAPVLNVLSLQESKGLDLDELSTNLAPFGVQRGTLKALLDTFAHAKTFGSLIQTPEALDGKLVELGNGLRQALERGDLYAKAAAQDLMPLLGQAIVLAMKFDAVVANPPYIGNKYQTSALKNFLKASYKGFDKDLFSAFMVRNLSLANPTGQLGFMAPFVWMFISSYEEVRLKFMRDSAITSLVQLEYSGFDGATVPICTFTLSNRFLGNYKGTYIRLSEFRGPDIQATKTLEAIQNRSCSWRYEANQDDFSKIETAPIAYWLSKPLIRAFENPKISSIAETRVGCQTSDNGRFLRLWHEVAYGKFSDTAKSREDAASMKEKWFPYNKGGQYRKWYGNFDFVVNWENGGDEVFAYARSLYGSPTRTVKNGDFYFRESITWSKISSGSPSFRFQPSGAIFDVAGASLFFDGNDIRDQLLCFLNSVVAKKFLEAISPTLNYETSHIGSLPIKFPADSERIKFIAARAIETAKIDWNTQETSWNFDRLSIVDAANRSSLISDCWYEWERGFKDRRSLMQGLQEENNSLFIKVFGLEEVLSSEVSDEELSLFNANREKDCQRLISY